MHSDQQYQEIITTGREKLRAVGFDVDSLSDDVIFGFMQDAHGDTSVFDQAKSEETTGASYTIFDEDTGMWYTQDGEVLGYRQTQHLSAEHWLEQMGERLTYLEGRHAAETAAKQVWLDKAASVYDPKINKLQRSIDWLKHTAALVGRQVIDAHNKTLEDSGKPRVKHLKFGLMTVQLTANRSRVEVVDEKLAIGELRALYQEQYDALEDHAIETIRQATSPEAITEAKELLRKLYGKELLPAEAWINKKESVAKSAIDDDSKAALDLENIYFIPGGTYDDCTVK